MIEWLIKYSLKNRGLILILTVLIALAGIHAIATIKLDAIPDLSDVQVIVYTEYPDQSPQVVEDQVTYPLTTALLSVPYAKTVRGYSMFGFSMVYVIFEDGTDLYWARSRVLEYLNYVTNRLPGGVSPQLGPDATGVGWVYEYILDVDPQHKDDYDLAKLRSIQDWYLKYELSGLPGVSEVASLGGFVKQYQVTLDPAALQAYGISSGQVISAIKNSNRDVGAGLIEQGETEFMVRGLGYIQGMDDISNIAIGADFNGTPLLLGQVARVAIGPETRRGIADWNGQGETVGGIVIMRNGENALRVINAVKEKLEDLKQGLPPGVNIKVAYDRSELILSAIGNLRNTLLQEMLVVGLVCLIFLLRFRSSLVSFVSIPLGILMSFIIMRQFGINVNIMSLGGIAIAIGVMVDASVVLVENLHKHLEDPNDTRSHYQIVLDASKEVGPSVFFSLLIIVVSFLPVFTLGEQSGRLFRPLAYTKTFAMAAGALIAVTVIPVLMYYFVKGKVKSEDENPVSRFFINSYKPLMSWALKNKLLVVAASAFILLLTIWPVMKLGSEFMPPLDEGTILYMPTTDPGISITKARELLEQTDRLIKTVPEVDTVFGKIGRADTATDPAPLMMLETIIQLKPKREWRRGMTTEKLINELNGRVNIPGLTNAWTMPIKTRIDMLTTGIKTPVGIKVMGDDLETLSRIGGEIAAQIVTVRGTLSAYAEKSLGSNYLDITMNRDAIARFGLTVNDVQSTLAATVGGINVTSTVEGLERYSINVRYPRDFRDNLDSVERILVPTPAGGSVPLSQLATFEFNKGPEEIKSENARRTSWVYVDVRDRDIGSYVNEAKALINAKIASGDIQLPTGYNIIWSGQYEYMQKANATLRIVVPLTLLIIIILLYIHLRSFAQVCIHILSVPFSLVGGFWYLYLLHYNTSVAVWVGFIGLAGIAAGTGIVMIVYINIAIEKFTREGRMNSIADLDSAIMHGAVQRVRPKLMTVFTAMVSLVPVMLGHETGSEVMKRMASPMIGGLFSATLLTLFIIPVAYGLVYEHILFKGKKPAS
jgi:Cu(I)/Ag(I) efflux system membrane protein CusA/SilA